LEGFAVRPQELRDVAVEGPAAQEEDLSRILEAEFGQPPAVRIDAISGRVRVSVYWSMADEEVAEVRNELRGALREEGLAGRVEAPVRLSIRKVPARDWGESWKRHFKPLEFGNALLVKPTWSRRAPKQGQALVLLDPGLSFGTGQHPTTHYCLEQVVHWRKPGGSFLDLGCGSGILSIAAAALGYGKVRALDFDPAAVRIARQNVKINRLEHVFRPVRGDVTRLPHTPGETADVVAANLLHDILISEADRISAQVTPGGVLIIAGILKTHFTAVSKAYTDLGFKPAGSKEDGEWRSGCLRRP
jgi:ribosomal protein L11 methyltransferase